MSNVYKVKGFSEVVPGSGISLCTEYVAANNIEDVVGHYKDTNLESIKCLGEIKKIPKIASKSDPKLLHISVEVTLHEDVAKGLSPGMTFPFEGVDYKLHHIGTVNDFRPQGYNKTFTLMLVPL